MSLLGRLLDLFEAKTHALLGALESPQENLELSYEKMLTGLQQTRRHLADVITERAALERQLAAAADEAARAEDDARTALGAGREDLAVAALRHKQAALQKGASLRQAHDALVPQIDKLVRYQHDLEAKIEAFRTDKEVLKATYIAAKAQVQVTESLTGLGSGLNNANETMTRARDRVQAIQARADALGEMVQQGINDVGNRNGIELELQELRATTAIDADLARLKAEIAPKPVLLGRTLLEDGTQTGADSIRQGNLD